MSALFANDVVANALDEDDGMPPLVDNPYPTMTFTFATEMTPITFSADANTPELSPEAPGGDIAVYSPPSSPALGAVRSSHAKKRDASYIPRPPNAFILFRSSFIREQHIPGKIEGNHSALSKIIGKYWKSLPREERGKWEAKAVAALAEHRQRYPDWRFRPSANALVKVKDGPKRRSNKKGRGEAEKEERSREKRCAKIADLLAAGKKGPELEAAIKVYDSEVGGGVQVKQERGTSVLVGLAADGSETKVALCSGPLSPAAFPQGTAQGADVCQPAGSLAARTHTPVSSYNAKFKIPLTAMFKRSSSAPASHIRSTSFYSATTSPIFAERRYSVDATFAPMAYAPFVAHPEHEGKPRVGDDVCSAYDCSEAAAMDYVAATPQSLQSFNDSARIQQATGTASQYNNVYGLTPLEVNCYSPSLPAFEPDVEGAFSPLLSPASDFASESEIAGIYGPSAYDALSPRQSAYSSLRGWAGNAYEAQDLPMSPLSPLSIARPPFVYDADPAGIMKDAFDAASSAIYGDWNSGISVALPDQNYMNAFPWNSPAGMKSLEHYTQGIEDLNCREDNFQLSAYTPFPPARVGAFPQL